MKTAFADNPKRISRAIVLVAFVLAIAAVIIAPIVALQWSARPFPGFLVEQTLVVSNTGSDGWKGLILGLHYPMRVIQLNNFPVTDEGIFAKLLSQANVGEVVSVSVDSPAGIRRDFHLLELTAFPGQDLLRLFWLPYAIGVLYLLLGISIYRLRGEKPAGRAFAFFSACAAIVSVSTFDVWTSHVLTPLWTFAVAQLGGAVIGLAMLFPTEAPALTRRLWARALVYGASLLLAGWGLATIYDRAHPWSYVLPWQLSYLYGAIGLGIFILSMFYRLRKPLAPIERQQVRIILWGSLLAFTPVGIWFAVQLFFNVPFNPLYISPLLVFFPVAIALAMLRYHLWEIDWVVRRTIVYTLLTGLLIVIYLAMVIGFDSIFDRYLGESNWFNVIATVVIVLIFTPVRNVIQRLVDRYLYRKSYRAERLVQNFSNHLRSQVDLDQLTDELINVVQETIQPETLSLWIAPRRGNEGGTNV